MFSRHFSRGPTWTAHPTVDLALNFHKKIPLYVPSSLNNSEGGHYCFSTLHRGAFCQFPFRWIYHCHSSKSTGKKTDKTHLCGVRYLLDFDLKIRSGQVCNMNMYKKKKKRNKIISMLFMLFILFTVWLLNDISILVWNK